MIAAWDAAAGTVTIAPDEASCASCSVLTRIRINGVAGHWKCLTDDAAPAPVAAMKLRFLADLEGAYAPKKKIDGKMRGPWWRPPLPEVTDLVQTSGWNWARSYDGKSAILDRAGAWISAASSVEVAHGALAHTGPGLFQGRPGFYKVPYFPWRETRVPHPMGGAALLGAREGHAWVPHTRVALLDQLARADRWPEFAATDSYTSDVPVRLSKWATHVNTVRAAVITSHGRDSEEYDQLKIAFSQAVTLMLGTRAAGSGRTWKCGVHHPDWAVAIQDLSAVTLWRWADDCVAIALQQKQPQLAPVALRAVDELLVPAEAVELFTTHLRVDGRPPMKLDPTGIQLGTFKVKGFE